MEKFLQVLTAKESLWVLFVFVVVGVAYHYRSKSWIRKILKPLIINAENTHLKGEGKLLKVMKDFRDLTPPFVKALVSDTFLKNKIEEVLNTLQETFKIEKGELENREIDKIISEYRELLETIKDPNDKEIINKRIESLEKLKV